MRLLVCLSLCLAGCLSSFAQVFTGSNAPGATSDFTIAVDASTTNLSLTVPGGVSAYSYIFIKRGSMATAANYDFSSQVIGQTNGLYLQAPEVSSGTYWVRVSTPPNSAAHAFTLTVEANRKDLGSAARPVTKTLSSSFVGMATNAAWQYFRVELTSNTFWEVTVSGASQAAPDLYVQKDQLPTLSSSLQSSINQTNDLIVLAANQAAQGVYYIGVYGANAPAGGTRYNLGVQTLLLQELTWDPGVADSGTQVFSCSNSVAGDYFFHLFTANSSLGAWRTALRVYTNEADLYLKMGNLPSPTTADFKSERQGSDGMVLGLNTQFQPGQDWYILVRAQAGAQWTLLSGEPFVTDLGTVAADGSSSSGDMQIGPEGMRFFSADAPSQMYAWRLWLNGLTNSILLKKAGVPLPSGNGFDQGQSGQMLVVPPYLSVAQYFIGVPGAPGASINLDSRQQLVFDLPYNSSFTTNLAGFGYTTFRVVVPTNQIAWQLTLPSTNGNPNFAVRRNTVPNENNNDGFSELTGSIANNLTLVPPVLSDGTFYVTVYTTNFTAANAYQFALQSGPATITDIPYRGLITNDDPTRVGWRFYRVTDIASQGGSLGWDLLLTNFAPGTRIALRRNAAPGLWSLRSPSLLQATYYDFLSTADFLQQPAHQADIWYIGIYNPTNALGPFTLLTRELQAAPLSENVPVVRSNVLSGRWDFFSFSLSAQDIAGAGNQGPILGWDLRLTNVTSGQPRIVVRRDGFPTNLTTTVTKTGTNWPSGLQWAADKDWTKRSLGSNGTNQDGEILAMALGQPLEPGTYYVGVLDSAGTNNLNYTLVSRWIGVGHTISVKDLNWSGDSDTNSLNPREAGYYRIVLPPNTPSWKVHLATLSGGESMMVVTSNTIPNVESEKRMQKPGDEYYLRLPVPNSAYLSPGTNYIAVIGEGVSPSDNNHIGNGPSSYVLQTLGPLQETELGLLDQADLVTQGSLNGSESAAYHFTTALGTLGFWITLENSVGYPCVVARPGDALVDPGSSALGMGIDNYGNEGGALAQAASASMIVAALTNSTSPASFTLMVKARQLQGTYPAASYTLRVREIVPQTLTFDSGTNQIIDQAVQFGNFFSVNVPNDALGWDLRLTDVSSGAPQLIIGQGILPVAPTTTGFSPDPFGATNWPPGATWAATTDWSERGFSADGTNESGQILAMGMGRPLQPGQYFVGVLGTAGLTVNCSLLSRGIGGPYALPVTDLDFYAGQVTSTNLPIREADYYRVTIPTNTSSWKVQLSGITGDSLLLVSKDTLPNVGARQDKSVVGTGGKKMQKIGDEQFLLLPPPGSNTLTAGVYYLAVVSEGLNVTNQTRMGTGASSYTLTSLGQAPVIDLGDLSTGELTDTNSLLGGEVRIYQFSVPLGVQTVLASLLDVTGNPTMVLKAGAKVPNPGALSGQPDTYGNDGGEPQVDGISSGLLTIANPTNGLYTLVIKARGAPNSSGASQVISNATYSLHIDSSTTVPIDFDSGAATILGQLPSTWRFFQVTVPTNAFGWDLRLVNVTNGSPHLVVRCGSQPVGAATSPWSTPGMLTSWPSNSQWAPLQDWTKRSYSPTGTNEDGRIFEAGLNHPLQPGVYFVGVTNAGTAPSTYTILSRGIGTNFSIPVLDLPFVGSVTNLALPAREAACYRVVVPSNSPSWELKLTGLSGETMLAGLSGALPNSDTVNLAGSMASGIGMQKVGNESYVSLPTAPQTTIRPGTNYLAVISEGVNPGMVNGQSRIGSGSSGYVLTSVGALPVVNLGLATSEDLVYADTLDGGETKAYQFTVPWETQGLEVRLEDRQGNPVAVALAGNQLPNPGAAVSGLPSDSYGNEGGYTPSDGHSAIVTLASPNVGTYSLMVKARQTNNIYSSASYTLRVAEVLTPILNFSGEWDTNGLDNVVSGALQDNERAFFQVYIPATNADGQPVIGWKLDLSQTNGLASMRVRPGLLPSDANTTAQIPFTTASAVIAPPFLTNGVWFVEVKATGSTTYTLRSSALTLKRPAWTMPTPGATNSTPGLTLPLFADTGVDTNGLPLAGDQGIDIAQGSMDYYAIQVPGTNLGLLRVELDAISFNPDLYLRAGFVPTLSHALNGVAGSIYDRSMNSAAQTEYANWVPFDGKLESQLKPGLYYLAVRASGNANARYRLKMSLGSVTDLSFQSPGLTNQFVNGGDWCYYRVAMPTALPLNFNVIFSQQSGHAVLHMRDTIPPGNGTTGSGGTADYRDWTSDRKNNWPYGSYDTPGTYTFSAPWVRPGQVLYLGFRAVNGADATFSVSVATNGAPVQEPTVVPFYGGTAATNLGAFAASVFRVDVPPEARRWIHYSTHTTNVVAYLEQGTLPTTNVYRWMSQGANSANSTNNQSLVTWNNAARQYVPGAWPWVSGQSYFLLVTNVTASPQNFTLTMDGRNDLTDDSDMDGLPDAWEYYYFGNLSQTAQGDPDHDGVSNLNEYLAGTDPTDPTSYPPSLNIITTNGVVVQQPPPSNFYVLGSTIQLTPVASPGYAFVGWGGDASGLNYPYSLTLDTNKTIIAYFKLAGDDFITALPLSGSAITAHGSNVSFTKEPGEPWHAGNPGGKSIWWTWNAPTSGLVSIDTGGTPFTTLLAVYTGSTVSNLTTIASNKNLTGGTNLVTFSAVAGTNYDIAVDGYNGAFGRIILNLNAATTNARPAKAAQLGPPGVLSNGTMQFTVSGDPSQNYVVEVSEDLVNWRTLSSVATAPNGMVVVTDTTTTGLNVRFYRVRPQ